MPKKEKPDPEQEEGKQVSRDIRQQQRQRVVVENRHSAPRPNEPRSQGARPPSSSEDATTRSRPQMGRGESSSIGYIPSNTPPARSREYFRSGSDRDGSMEVARSNPAVRSSGRHDSSRPGVDDRAAEYRSSARADQMRPAYNEEPVSSTRRDIDPRPTGAVSQQHQTPTTSAPFPPLYAGTLDRRRLDEISTAARPAVFGTPLSRYGQTGAGRPTTVDITAMQRTSTFPLPPSTGTTANTGAARTQRPSVVAFRSTLGLNLQTFANLPRGRLVNVFRHLRENPHIVNSDAETLLSEAVQAFTYAYLHGATSDGNKSEYAENCVQQCSLLRMLQRRIRESRQANLREVLQRLETDLQSDTTAQRELYKSINVVLEYAKTQAQAQAQAAGRRMQPDTATSSTQQYPPRRDPPDQGGVPVPASTRTQDLTSSFNAMNFQSTRGQPQVEPAQLSSRSQQTLPGNPTRPLRASSLSADYEVRGTGFYEVGRVFIMIHRKTFSEISPNDRGNSRHTNALSRVTYDSLGQPVHTTTRRMVVVREKQGCAICIPISTYGGRGLHKFKDDPQSIQEHAQIYMDDTKPMWLRGEPQSQNTAIAVHRTNSDENLSVDSRICFSQPETVQFTDKTADVGLITGTSLTNLLKYYKKANS